MTDREKLIELLRKTEINKINGHIVQACVSFQPFVFERMADHLLANGVTFDKDINIPTKWIPVTERLPEIREEVLAFTGFGCVCARCNGYNAWRSIWDGEEINDVTHWMPLPAPPKEE